MNKSRNERWEGLIWQLVAYAFALMIAWYVYDAFNLYSISLPLKLLICSIASTAVIFHFSYAFKNVSFYSIYWSIQPIVLTLFLLSQEQVGVDITRQTIVFLFILIWGFRLIWNFSQGWKGLEDEDWRYGKLRAVSGKWFPLVTFLGLMLFPTLLIFVACLPLIDALSKPSLAFGVFDGIAILLCLIGILLELFADNQLRDFRKNRENYTQVLNTGLWKYSRHPNYLGEVLFWFGIAIFGASAHGDIEWYHVMGTAGITSLIYFVSIPMQEKHFLEYKLNYNEEIKNRSKLMLWQPKK